MNRTDRPGLRLALLAISQFLIAVDFDIVFVALPSIGRDLGFSPQTLQWVISAYTVTTGGFLLFGGRAADRLGARRVFITGIAIFGAASLVGGLADSQTVLIGARAVQGLGGALLTPAVLRLINTTFEGTARVRAFTIWSMAGSSGAAVGAIGGGVLTSFLGWEWVLFVNVPVVVLAIIAAPRLLTRDTTVDGPRTGFDLPGAVVATVGATLLVFGLVSGPESGWRTPQGLGALVAGLGLLALFVWIEHRSPSPLMPLRLFANRSLVVAMAVVFIFMGVIGTEYFLFTNYVQNVLGYETLQAGLAFLPLSALSMIGAAKVAPYVVGRFGTRASITIGMAGVAASFAVFGITMTVGGEYWTLLPAIVLWGLGAGAAFPPIFMTAGAEVAPEEQGVAGAMASTAQFIGGAVLLAALVAVANAGIDLHAGTPAPVADVASGLRTAAFAAALVTLAGAGLARLLRKAPITDAAPVAETVPVA
ncbi:MFS transporter [Phytomonospora endophytica]|uniref:EmrB/QacA subfamily drug resistance transporter n=1 Tax=Phytomonospora endophytica TaxID=714109 RepID=A0A841FP31_9ACTN|nr:MFS transporter [Phytomonospora endophytica]MBB6035312.1 EmrB/QacA subfamily drug resistance transporter [Phytomonospora endophytica]GIG63939.1 MFS transporter [Phytomonospora endophytica]